MELEILGKDVLRTKLAYVIPFINLCALILHAGDLQDASFFDFYLQMVLDAIFALQMPT